MFYWGDTPVAGAKCVFEGRGGTDLQCRLEFKNFYQVFHGYRVPLKRKQVVSWIEQKK